MDLAYFIPMLYGCGCGYRIRYGTGAAIRKILKMQDTDAAIQYINIYIKYYMKVINKLKGVHAQL
jgi:hypothetical protein